MKTYVRGVLLRRKREDKSLLYVCGNVPGPVGGLVKIRDGFKKVYEQVFNLDYPTYIPKDGEESVLTWDGGSVDPMEIYYHENDVVSGTGDDD